DVVAAVLGGVRLQELAVGVELDGEQVRHLEDARPLAEILADTLLLGEGICHCDHPLHGRVRGQVSSTPKKVQGRASRPAGFPASRPASATGTKPAHRGYLISAAAPASSSFFLMLSASAFGMLS